MYGIKIKGTDKWFQGFDKFQQPVWGDERNARPYDDPLHAELQIALLESSDREVTPCVK